MTTRTEILKEIVIACENIGMLENVEITEETNIFDDDIDDIDDLDRIELVMTMERHYENFCIYRQRIR